jgi:hypothetical protein
VPADHYDDLDARTDLVFRDGTGAAAPADVNRSTTGTASSSTSLR